MRQRRHRHAERDRDQHRREEREPGQLQCRRQPGADDVGDRLAGHHRGAEVTVQDVCARSRRTGRAAGRRGPSASRRSSTSSAGALVPSDARTGRRDEVDHHERRRQQQRHGDEEPGRAADGVGGPRMARPPPSSGRPEAGVPVTSPRQPQARRHDAGCVESERGVPSVHGHGERARGRDVALADQRPLALEPVLAARGTDSPRSRARRTSGTAALSMCAEVRAVRRSVGPERNGVSCAGLDTPIPISTTSQSPVRTTHPAERRWSCPRA